MRAFFVLLAAVVILVASASAVSGLNINLQASQNVANAAMDTHSIGARMLRADATTGESIDEERGIADIAKKLGTKAKSFMKDQYHWLYVYWKSAAQNQDETAKLFLKKNIHPDKVKKWLGADKAGDGPELELFLKYKSLWDSVHRK